MVYSLLLRVHVHVHRISMALVLNSSWYRPTTRVKPFLLLSRVCIPGMTTSLRGGMGMRLPYVCLLAWLRVHNALSSRVVDVVIAIGRLVATVLYSGS